MANLVTTTDPDLYAVKAYAEIAATTLGTQQSGIDNATFVKINQFNSIVRQTNMTISGPNNNITINTPGLFMVQSSVSFFGTSNTDFEIAVHKNDVKVQHMSAVRSMGAGTDVGDIMIIGTDQLAVNDVIDLRVISDDIAGANFRVVRANFIIFRIR